VNPQSFRYQEQDAVATLTLDRPARLNALTFEVYRELTLAFRTLQAREQVRAVVLTGAGEAFCSGGDVLDIIGPLLANDDGALLDFTRATCELVRAMRALDKPIVAALNGQAAGAGAALAVAADLRIAAEHARIAFLFVRVGLAGADMGVAWLLPRIVGLGRASQLLMTGEFTDAAEAQRIGLYNQVVPRAELAAAARDTALRLARGPSEALAATKRALQRELFMDLDTALEEEARLQAELMQRPDFREGYQAFRERRAPRFKGAPE
jgi:enoyl-CoA hydratase/carnithine racemase